MDTENNKNVNLTGNALLEQLANEPAPEKVGFWSIISALFGSAPTPEATPRKNKRKGRAVLNLLSDDPSRLLVDNTPLILDDGFYISNGRCKNEQHERTSIK